MNRKKTNWIGHVLRRNCFLRHVIEGKIDKRIKVMRRRVRRSKQLLNDRKERRGYWNLNEEALDRIVQRTRFGRRRGPVVRHKE